MTAPGHEEDERKETGKNSFLGSMNMTRKFREAEKGVRGWEIRPQ